jgi:hypothetical protein
VAIKELETALDHLAAITTQGQLDHVLGATVEALSRVESRTAGERARWTGSWDAQCSWAADEALSGHAWLRWRCRRSKGAAGAEIARARALRHMPLTAAALSAGDITVSHVRTLMDARETSPEAFERHEAMLVGFATDARAPWLEWFNRKVAYWKQVVEPDKVEEQAVARYNKRGVHSSATYEGVGVINGILDPVSFAIVDGELKRLEHEMWESDWASVRQREAEGEVLPLLLRTPPQRRADALRVMAERSAAMPPDAKRARIIATVLVGYETLHGRACELSNGTVLTPGELLPLLAHADIERAVFDPAGRVLDLGRRSRLFTGAVRRAIELRDRTCTHPTCDRTAAQCEGDHHPIAWTDGGETNQDNGRMRCPGHHPGRRKPKEPRPPPMDDG